MQLTRSIGLVGLTFVAVSGIIGSGWLFAPLLTSRLAGPASILSWVIGGAAMLVLALCFAEVTGILPVAGGIARLPHFTHGDVTSAVLGWSAWVGYNTAAPIETIAMLQYLSAEFEWLFISTSARGDLSITGCLVAVAILVMFVLVNSRGAAFFAKANTVIACIKLTVPLIVGLAIISTRCELDNFTAGGFAPSGIEGILAAVSAGGIIFALIGFRHAIDLAGEVKNPQVTIPLALTLAIVICIGIYLVLQIAFIGALSPSILCGGWSNIHFTHDLGPMAAVAAALGIGWMSFTVYTGAIVAPFGGGLVATASMARLGYALSQNGFFPGCFQKLSKRGIPLRSLLFNLVFGVLVVFLVPFDEAVSINAAAITLSFCAGPLAVSALRHQMPDVPRAFRLPAAWFVSRTGFIVATMIVYWSGWHTTWRLGIIMLLGLMIFAIKNRINGITIADLDIKQACWLLPFSAGIAALSYLGSFSGGKGVLVYPWDLLAATLLSLATFELADRSRLPNQVAARYREQYRTPPEPDMAPL